MPGRSQRWWCGSQIRSGKVTLLPPAVSSDDLPLPQVGDAVGVTAEPREHVVGVLADEAAGAAGTTTARQRHERGQTRVLAEHPNLGVPRLIDTLRETSEPVKPGGPKLLNLEKALARLSG